jgi:membrane-associated progesterone receptor component
MVFLPLLEWPSLVLVLSICLGGLGLFAFVCMGSGDTGGEVESKEVNDEKPPDSVSSDGGPITMTKEELKKYTGTNGGKRYVCVKKVIFDVSSADFYAPGNSYNCFCGYDASRALAKMSLKPEDVENSDTSDLSLSEQDVLDEWFLKFSSKYEKVGTLVV